VNRLVREAVQDHLLLLKNDNTTATNGGEQHKSLDWRILDVGCGVGGTLYAMLPDNCRGHKLEHKFSYTGVSTSIAEIHFANSLLVHHRLHSGHAIQFRQQSFDQTLPEGEFTVAVAIESLSYSRNLENTVGNICASLKPGGVLVIVDDVVYPDVHVSDVDATLRPSLVPHSSWMTVLRGFCTAVEARDLSLEYQVLLGHDLSLLRSHPEAIWGVVPLSTPWERFRAASGNAASQRLLELQEERAQLAGLIQRRQDGYGKHASLSYNMYICKK
jgi:SAM-dependent methyltransferase